MATGINNMGSTQQFSLATVNVSGFHSTSAVTAPDTPSGTATRFNFTDGSTVNVVGFVDIPDSSDLSLVMMVRRPALNDHIAALALVDSTDYIAGLRNNSADMTVRTFGTSGLTTIQNKAHGMGDASGWVWLELVKSGTTGILRVWQADLSKADFGAQTTSAASISFTVPSGPTSPGVAFVLTATPDRYMDVAYLAYGTEGDAAPLPGDSVGGGTGGGHIDIRNNGTHIQKQVEVGGPWIDVVALADLQGPAGEDGAPGAPGAEQMIRVENLVLQTKYTDETVWADVFDFASLGGGDGSAYIQLRNNGTAIQVQYAAGGAWTDLVLLADLQGPAGADGANGADGERQQLRVENDLLQTKYESDTTWTTHYDFSNLGGGGGTVINVVGRHVSNRQMDIQATSDPVLGRQRFQEFVDNVASDNVTGYIDAALWAIDGTVFLPPGIRLVGRGMEQTVIDCPTGAWSSSDFYAMRLTAGINGVISPAFYLSDFRVVGADKTRSDNGPLVRIDGVRDGVVERMGFVDPSSYGLFISGYGLGGFTNDIEDEFWNSTHQVTVRDCRAIRGQIGFGTEGGAEHVFFSRCISVGNPDGGLGGLHGYRSASGYGVTYSECWAVGYRNGFLLDRHRDVTIRNCLMDQTRNGIALGSFYSSDPAISTSTRIVGNKIRCNLPDGGTKRAVNDSFISNRVVNGVTVADNFIYEGDILLLQAHRMSVHDNIDLTGGSNDIITGSSSSGVVHDNLMNVNNSSGNVAVRNNNAV